MIRASWPVWIALGLGCAGIGAPQENAMKVSRDLDGLSKHITVPAGIGSAHWAARARGTPGLGPTDLELVALFPLSDGQWVDLGGTLGPEGAPATLGAPEALTDALDLDGPVTGLALPCSPYTNIRWSCARALRTDAGVVVYLTSR